MSWYRLGCHADTDMATLVASCVDRTMLDRIMGSRVMLANMGASPQDIMILGRADVVDDSMAIHVRFDANTMDDVRLPDGSVRPDSPAE